MRQLLKKSQLFAGFDDSSLDKVLLATSLKTVSKGEMIFHEGDEANAFFITGTGKIKIFKLSQEGKEQILMIAAQGDSFAEAALFGSGKYPASAQALENSKLLVINRDRFINLVEQNPNIAINLVARLAELLHKLNRLIEDLSLTDVTTRLAYYLIQKTEESKPEKAPITLTLTEKKSVLASQLGTIPETLSRSLAKLIKEKIITVDGSRIEIHDPKRLEQLAGR